VALSQDIYTFFMSVITHWQAYVTGGAVVALVTLYERLSGNEISPRVVVYGFIAFLVVAFFMAWRDVRNEANVYKQNLDDLQKSLDMERTKNTPDFVGEIEQIVSGDSPEIHGCQIFILMSIRNHGSQSIVEGWKIHIKSSSIDVRDNPTFIPDGFTLIIESKKKTVTFNRSDAIYEKTIKPIERGGLVRGWLRYTIQGINAYQIREPGTTISISFEDILKHQYSADYVMKGGPGEKPMYFPGAEQPFKNIE
jgi:hypothetical protein